MILALRRIAIMFFIFWSIYHGGRFFVNWASADICRTNHSAGEYNCQ